MGRPKQGRKRHYKSYWDKDGETDIPESTLRYKKRRMEDAWIVEDTQEAFPPEDSPMDEESNRGGNESPSSSDGSHTSHRIKSSDEESVQIDRSPVRSCENQNQLQIDGTGDSDEGGNKSPYSSDVSHTSHQIESSDEESLQSDRRSARSYQNQNQHQIDGTGDSDESGNKSPCSSDGSHTSHQIDSSDEESLQSDRSPARSYQNQNQHQVDGTGDSDEGGSTSSSSSDSSHDSHRTESSDEESERSDCSQEREYQDAGGSYSSSEETGCQEHEFNQQYFDNDSESSHQHEERAEDRHTSDCGDDNGDEEANVSKDPFERLKSCLKGPFGEKKDLKVTISVGEVLTNALILVKKHNWSHLEKENLMKFINSIFNNGNFVPSSRFLLDEYFFSKEDMWYYFFCSNCTTLLGDASPKHVRPSQIVCQNDNCNFVNDLSDLSQASYFVTFDLRPQIELLLSDPNVRRKLVSPSQFLEASADVLKDVYDGTVYREFAQQVQGQISAGFKVISFTLSVDSASLCTFSGQSICPCFVMINELPPVLRMGHPLLAGLWFGKVKEKMDLLLPPVVSHITQLSEQGFTLDFGEELWNVKAYLIACCADSVARCDIQGIHAHRGDFPCSWCLEEGEEGESSRLFRYHGPLAPPRTLKELMEDAAEALRTKKVVNGVKYLSPLSAAPLFHAVNGFIVAQIHAKDEGTTKSFLHAWLHGEQASKRTGTQGKQVEKRKKEPYYIGTEANLKKLNSRMKQILLPKEARKSIRNLQDLGYWTAREFENFCLFFSVPVLTDILPNKYLKHWALYVQAMHILLSSEIPASAVKIAEDLVEKFCSQVEEFYCPKMMRFNLHILRHFCANCLRFGPIFALSAYGFEAGNQKLKKLVHSAKFISNQVCRGFSEENALQILRKYCSSPITESFERNINRTMSATSVELPGNVSLLQKSQPFQATKEEEWFLNRLGKRSCDFVCYRQLKKNGCHFGTSIGKKTDNAFARLDNKKIILIRKILYHESSNNVWVVGSLVRCEPSPYCPHEVVRDHPHLVFQFIVKSIDEDINLFQVDLLQTVCVSVKTNQMHYLSPMPNIFNMY